MRPPLDPETDAGLCLPEMSLAEVERAEDESAGWGTARWLTGFFGQGACESRCLNLKSSRCYSRRSGARSPLPSSRIGREEEGRGEDYTVRTFRCADAIDRLRDPLPQLAASGVRADRVRPGLVPVPARKHASGCWCLRQLRLRWVGGRLQHGQRLLGRSRLASSLTDSLWRAALYPQSWGHKETGPSHPFSSPASSRIRDRFCWWDQITRSRPSALCSAAMTGAGFWVWLGPAPVKHYSARAMHGLLLGPGVGNRDFRCTTSRSVT